MVAKPLLLLVKSSIPEGSRWITIKPHGPAEKGQPVLIQPQADGSAKVIGGAGGKLNHLRIRAVRSESEYKKEAEDRKVARAAEKKAQQAKDREAGLVESKKKAREAVREQQRKHEKEFVHTVADAMGWDKQELEFKAPEGVSEAAVQKLAEKHHRAVLDRASQAVELQQQRLVTDADARAEAGLSEVPLETAEPDQLSVADLAPVPVADGGLGFSSDFKGRAEAAGLTADELKAEAGAVREQKQAAMTPTQRQAAIERGETAKMVAAEVKAIREPVIKAPIDLVDAKKAVELLKARKKLREVAKQARVANKEIDKAAVEPKAFVLQYTASPDDDAAIQQEVDDALRTARTSAFLSEFKRIAGEAPEETLGKHVGVGAFNSINALALAVGGDALVDRSVVDVLGIAGAAQVLARRIHADLGDTVGAIADGVQDFHLHHYMETSQSAMDQAKDLMDAAREIEVGEAGNAHELAAGQELNAKKRSAIADAQKVLGQAYGEMEANAALAVALKRKPADRLEVPLGKMSPESAIQRARAIGLQRGDYTVDTVAGNTFLNVTGAGLDRLAKPIARADVEQVKRNLDIINGGQDEDDWLPIGVARRPDLGLDVKPGVAPRFAEPFQPGEDLQQSLRDYIGGRAADGDPPADIIADIQSAEFFQKAGDAEAYRKALDAVAPLKDAAGKQQRAEALGETFDGYADSFMAARGGGRSALNRQQVPVDQVTVDALHRALSEHPDGVAAFKQIGEMTNQDQRALRETFYRDVAKESPEAAALRADLEAHTAAEPERETEDMFGERVTNPEWEDWRARRDELAGKAGAASLDWQKYIGTMGGHEKAYEAIQDLIKSRVSKSFAENHNKLRPGSPIKLGRSVIRNNLNHLDATDQEARDARLARNRELVDSMRERDAGRYAAGSVSDKLDAAREQREAFEQAQMGFFGAEEPQGPAAEKPLGGDERHTVGHVVERQIAGLMPQVGANFKPGQPTKLFAPNMSGGDNFARQRAIKLIDANKRMGLHLGAGSGKTLVAMAAFTHAHGQGKVKRGLFAVPSIVQGQFGGEALRFLEPGKYKWHCDPGASREERIKGYKDPTNHFCVVTHQALRDDLIHLGAKHAGISENQMRDNLAPMTRAERKEWAAQTLKREGINFDFSAVDEGHNLLDRAGKEDSGMSMAIGGLTDHTPYHVSMTADPVRNDDATEVFSALQKVAPDRYTDRGEFMRRYGADTLSARDGLKREMARYFYAHKIEPKVNAARSTITAKLSESQQRDMAALDKDFSALRLARMAGKVDVEAARRVHPAAFEGQPADKHEAIAKDVQSTLGILRESAMQRMINAHPESGKIEETVRQVKAREGKPGIVFAHSLDAVKALQQRLEKEGLRVVTISGSDSTAEKDRKRQMFSPDGGQDAQADILVASDAASTGLNAQRGQWLMQYDTPMTAMTHAQRQARIHRIGQKNNIELIDMVADHPSERRARDRLAKKYRMRELMNSTAERLDDTGVAAFIKARQAAATDGQGSML